MLIPPMGVIQMCKPGNIFLQSVLLIVLILFQPQSSYAQARDYGLAVLDLQANNIAVSEAVALSDMLRSSIVNIINEKSVRLADSYIVIERSQMDKIFEQFEIQNTGCTDISCAVEFGKMLNVDRIIIGSVNLVGSTYLVIIRIVDVGLSTTIASVDRKQTGVIDNVIDLMPIVAHELLTGERLAAPVAPKLSPSSPTSPQGIERSQEQYLSISGTPESTGVYLNDEKIGETPIDYHAVNPGRYRVKITRSGYEDFEDEIVVPPGGKQTLSYTLIPYATLSFKGSPDYAVVFLDGDEVGETPIVDHQVTAGRYQIKINCEGFMEYEQSISVSPGEVKEISYSLTALAAISVDGFPAGAAVSLNGERVGETPLENHVIPEGRYKIKITGMGYEKYEKTVTVGPGDPAEIRYRLMPKMKSTVLKKSIILPGSGQRYAEYKVKGSLITILQLAAIGGIVATSLDASHAWSDYDEAEASYKNAPDESDFEGLYADLENKYDTASSSANIQMVVIGAAAAVYLYNIIDAMRTEPRVDVKPVSSSLHTEPVIGEKLAGISLGMRF